MPDVDKIMLALPEGEYEFDPDRLLSRSYLSHIKGWFPNSALWQYWPFLVALGCGDPDAVACAMWMIRRKEGINPNPEPKQIGRGETDFAVGETVIKPNRDEGIDPPRWLLKLDDEELVLDMDKDITCSQLRQIKKWYPHLGSFTDLYLGLLRGDPDAAACAIWLARTINGSQPNPLPRDMEDFSVGAVSSIPNAPGGDAEKLFDRPEPGNPTGTGKSPKISTRAKGQSGTSAETPTNSGSDTSPASDTTATSPPTT